MTNFSNFRVIEPETKDLALDLMEDAQRQRSAFVCLVAIWMTFNGGGPRARGTGADIIRAFATNARPRVRLER